MIRHRPHGKRPMTRRARVVLILVAVPFVLFFNLVTLSAIGSAGVLAVQAATGTVPRGVITDSASHSVNSRRGPDESYCFGRLSAADGSLTDVRVNVYVDAYCFDAGGREAAIVPGLARPLADRISDPDAASVGDPMPFNGLFGMTRGAVLDWGSFGRSLWPFLFLIPVTALIDVPLVNGIRGSVRASRRRRQSTG